MARDRSRPERTSEERERDRLERERRRAERSGTPLPEVPAPDEMPPGEDPVAPGEPSQPPSPDAPLAEVQADVPLAEQDWQPEAPEHAEQAEAAWERQDPARQAPSEQPWLQEDPAQARHAEDTWLPEDPAEPTSQEDPVQPPAATPDYSGPAEPEQAWTHTDTAAHDVPAEALPSAGREPAQEPLEPNREPEAPLEPNPEPEAPLEQEQPPKPVILGRSAGRTAKRPAADPEATQAYEIPGLPPEDPAPPPRHGLPDPPPRVAAGASQSGRRPFSPGAGEMAAGGTLSGGASRRRPTARGLGSRALAVFALFVVAAVVVLLVHSLKGSSKHKAIPSIPVVKVLIPEGKTRLQIAQIAQGAGLKGSYRAAARRSVLLNPATYGAPKDTPDLEGFLFPATYDMDKGASASRLVEEQLTAFRENFGSEDVSRAKALGVSPYGLLTVASMIEREAQIPGDRAKIAAVIYNRLKAGMPLGIDATIYYAVESKLNEPTYTHELTESQLQIDSPYNTRLHTGLPPTPISNPGVASIQAAAHPAHASYLYYVAAADGCGEQVFSTSQSAFEANVAAYEEAKRKNGGKPPACKKKH